MRLSEGWEESEMGTEAPTRLMGDTSDRSGLVIPQLE